MELRQLADPVAVARHGQFTRAADALWVTQSAISQQIRRLEAELGVTLLQRTPRGAELTAAGEDLCARAEVVLAEVARAREELSRHAGVTRGRVRIAATTTDAARLPRALAAFHREHPGLQLALRHASSAEVIGLVQTGAVDVGIAGHPGKAPAGLAAEPLADEPLRAMLPAGDPLAGRDLLPGELPAARDLIALGELRGRPFILAESGSLLRATVMAACQAAGFSPVPRSRSPTGPPSAISSKPASGSASSPPLGSTQGPPTWPGWPWPSRRHGTGWTS